MQDLVYTVTKQLRGRPDTPLRVLIQNNDTGEIMKHGYSIIKYELVILPGGRDELPPATAATRTQDTLLRLFAKPVIFAQRFKRGTKQFGT